MATDMQDRVSGIIEMEFVTSIGDLDIQAWIAPVVCSVGVITYFLSEEPLPRFLAAVMALSGGLMTCIEVWMSHGLRLQL